MKVRFRPEAADELREARDWYAAREQHLGDQFLAAVDATVQRIVEAQRVSRTWQRPRVGFGEPGTGRT